jgi:DNA-binding LytR/AlgR family response regulator
VDDEPLALDVIENYLQRLEDIDITRCENGVEAFKLIQNEKFDLVFLDIQMPLLTGMDLLKTMKDPPPIIITTAYREYAVEGFELEVLDYLVKPISFPRFMKSFERAVKLNRPEDSSDYKTPVRDADYLFLKVDRKFIKILTNDILYIESLKDYIRVTTRSNSWISYQSLSSITEQLPADKFMRVHRSFTVAIDKVSVIDGNCIEIEGKPIPVSRDHRLEVQKRIQKHKP